MSIQTMPRAVRGKPNGGCGTDNNMAVCIALGCVNMTSNDN